MGNLSEHSSSDRSVLALIPARAGSKGVPHKNVRMLAGRPVIAWTIEAALRCPTIERVVVSTDDPEIAEIARAHGAETPFLRPPELSLDDTPDHPVFRHALSELAANDYEPELVAWLRPTAPLRTADDIFGAIELAQTAAADCVRSVCLAEHHPQWMRRLEGGRLEPLIEGDPNRRRQDLPAVYRLNGAVDVVRTASVGNAGALFADDAYGYVMPAERSVDLDTELDFTLANALLDGRDR